MAAKQPDKRLESIKRKRDERRKVEIADWHLADPVLLQKAIAAVTAAGGAIRFGYTRDGGAYAVGLYMSNDHFTEYLRPADDLDGYLRDLADSFSTV